MKKSRKPIKSKIHNRIKIKTKLKVKKQRRGLKDVLKSIRPLSEREQSRLDRTLRKIEKTTLYNEGLNQEPGGFSIASVVDIDKDSIDVVLTYGVKSDKVDSKEKKIVIDRKTMRVAEGKSIKEDEVKKHKKEVGIDWHGSDFDTSEMDKIDDEIHSHVADSVEQGYTSGELQGEEPNYSGWWEIDIQDDENDEEIRNQEIARIIRNGNTSGYNPTFSFRADVYGKNSMATGGGIPDNKITKEDVYSKPIGYYTYEQRVNAIGADDVRKKYENQFLQSVKSPKKMTDKEIREKINELDNKGTNKSWGELEYKNLLVSEKNRRKKSSGGSMELGGGVDNGKYQINVHGQKPTDYKIVCRITRRDGEDIQVCYGETNNKKEKVVEVYSGENYIVGSKSKSFSRKYDIEETPVKYKAIVDELKEEHHRRFWGGGKMATGGGVKLGMKGSVLDALEDAGYIFDANELSEYFRGKGYKEYNNIKSLVAQDKLDTAVHILEKHIKISKETSKEKYKLHFDKLPPIIIEANSAEDADEIFRTMTREEAKERGIKSESYEGIDPDRIEKMEKGGKAGSLEKRAIDFLKENKDMDSDELFEKFEKEFKKEKPIVAETGGGIMVGIIPVSKTEVIGVGMENVVKYTSKEPMSPMEIFYDDDATDNAKVLYEAFEGGGKLDSKINNLKPGEKLTISKLGKNRVFAERTGDGKTLKFVRENPNGFEVISTQTF